MCYWFIKKKKSSLTCMESKSHGQDIRSIIHSLYCFFIQTYAWIVYCGSSIIHLISIYGIPIHLYQIGIVCAILCWFVQFSQQIIIEHLLSAGP